MIVAPLLLSLMQATAQPATASAPPAAAPAFASRHGGRLFISPMGEPFHPSGRDDDALADWFRQADRDHDGRLILSEMQQDADRFFASLDVNHDGEIDPDEISRYEEVVAPEIRSGEHYDLASFSSDGNERGGGRRRHRDKAFFGDSSTDQHQGAGRYGLLDLPEPVTAADSDFNRGVSTNEFRAAAQQRFQALDIDHKGYLTLADLEGIRPAPPAGSQKKRQDGPDEQDVAGSGPLPPDQQQQQQQPQQPY